jgi:hypothetical protein
MHNGQMRMFGGPDMKDKIAYAFGAEFVEIRINRWTHEIRVPRLRISQSVPLDTTIVVHFGHRVCISRKS